MKPVGKCVMAVAVLGCWLFHMWLISLVPVNLITMPWIIFSTSCLVALTAVTIWRGLCLL